MRTALERGDWDEVGRQIAIEWDNRKRLAPGVTTPAIDDLIARARAAGATAAKVCGAGGGGCLFCYGPPASARGDCRRAGRGRRAPARLPYRDRRPAGLDNLAIARILREIADLLEIKNDNPFKIRAYRNGADIVGQPSARALDAGRGRAARDPGHRQGPRRAHPRDRRDRRHRLPSRARRRVSADDPRPAASAGRRTEDGGDAVSRARDPHARRSRTRGAGRPHPRAARHGREEGSADPEGARRTEAVCRPAPAARRARRGGGARRATCASARRTPIIEPVGSLRRGCDTCGDLDMLASGAPAVADGCVRRVPSGRARARPRRDEIERAPPGRLPGRPAPGRRRQPRRRAAVLHRIEGAQHRAARSRDRPRLQAERVRPVPDRRTTSASPASARKTSTPRSAWTGFRRSCARCAARSTPPRPARCPA